MFAIIEDGGKQFKVTSGDVIRVDRDAETGATLSFDRVLLVAGDGEPKVGLPTVAGATVTAEVLGAVLGEKTMIRKHRRRKGYDKTKGHRQQYTSVKITAINA